MQLRLVAAGAVIVGWIAGHPLGAGAVPLDAEGTLTLSVRTYVNARIGTEDTDNGSAYLRSRNGAVTVYPLGTFPPSAGGHLRQNRYFLEAELNHDLGPLVERGVGPLSLLHDLPFRVTGLKYTLTFRGAGDTLYDWGPREYSTAAAFQPVARIPVLGVNQAGPPIADLRKRLRDVASQREQLFQAYVEGSVGDLFVRFGRQNLSWGETDGFRLLDNINPLDNSFGGFLISLDERRVPLDMLRAQYNFGSLGPLSDGYLEGYVAIDESVGFLPIIPAGSPWSPPNTLSTVYTLLRPIGQGPARTFSDARGGGRFVFNLADTTFSVAHYYTYWELPSVQAFTNGLNPLIAFNDRLPCPRNPFDPSQGNRPGDPVCGYLTHALLDAARVQITGGSATFALPRFYAVVRSEFAYIRDEPGYTQGQLDPFLFTTGATTGSPAATGGQQFRDTYNAVLGLDVQQFIRFLNPAQSFFFSAQFFYKHIANAGDSNVYLPDGTLNPRREVIPIAVDALPLAGLPIPFASGLDPVYATQPADTYLNTLVVATTYLSGRVTPVFVLFYDWGGSLLYQPGVTVTRDPFRFTVNYTIIDAGSLKGGSGVSLGRDRDNVEFRVEYVL